MLLKIGFFLVPGPRVLSLAPRRIPRTWTCPGVMRWLPCCCCCRCCCTAWWSTKSSPKVSRFLSSKLLIIVSHYCSVLFVEGFQPHPQLFRFHQFMFQCCHLAFKLLPLLGVRRAVLSQLKGGHCEIRNTFFLHKTLKRIWCKPAQFRYAVFGSGLHPVTWEPASGRAYLPPTSFPSGNSEPGP